MWVTDLFDEVPIQSDVLAGLMRNIVGANVTQSLWLMDDSINVWEVLPVLYSNRTASNHPPQFLMDLVWMYVKYKFNLINMKCFFNPKFRVLAEIMCDVFCFLYLEYEDTLPWKAKPTEVYVLQCPFQLQIYLSLSEADSHNDSVNPWFQTPGITSRGEELYLIIHWSVLSA